MAEKRISKKRADHILGEVKDYFQDAEDWIARKSPDILERAAFFKGKQYVYTGKARAFDNISARGELMEMINICRPLARASAASTLAQIPNPKIPSAKDDEEARIRAETTERFCRAFFRNGIIDFDELYRAVLWAEQTGAAWVKIPWDPDAGQFLPSMKTGLEGEPKDDEVEDIFGEPIVEAVRTGEIVTEFVSTIDGIPNPCCSLKEMSRFFHRKLMLLSDAYDRWPTDYFGDDTRGKFDTGNFRPEQQAFRALEDDDDYIGPSGSTARQGGGNVLVQTVDFWMLPNKRFPNGLFVVFSGTTLLEVGPNPYWPRRIPFVLLDGDNKNSGSLYADGMLADIVPIQKNINHLETKIMELIRKMANAHLLAPIGSGVDRNTWGELPGQVIPYHYGYKPEVMQAHDVPPGLLNQANIIIERAKYVSGYSDIASGNIPRDTSGRTVAFATQNEERMRAPKMHSHRLSMVAIMEHCRHHVHQRYDDGRIIRTIGVTGDLELAEFRSEDYDWDNDLAPEPYSDLPQSFASRLARVIEYKGAGLFETSPDAERARRLLGGDFANSDYDFASPDRHRARRENLACLRNPMQIPNVRSYDIHEIHLEEHNRFRKSVAFEKLPVWAQQRFDMHCALHELMKVRSMPGGDLENQRPHVDIPSPMLQPGPNGIPSPPDGGANQVQNGGGAPPTSEEFTNMSDSEQRSADQQS